MLTSTTFRQQTLASKKLYNRKKTKEERTHSEEMQDRLEPIPCPMYEDYDDEKDNV